MPGPASARKIVQALIKAGERARKDFYEISGEEWLDEAPEYFLTTYAARSVGCLEGVSTLLEVPVDATRKEAGAIRTGRPAGYERRNGRFDIVVYWANGAPRAAIEVKSPLWSATIQNIEPDIRRLCKTILVNKDSTFQFGAFLFYASVSNPKQKYDNSKDKLDGLLSRIKEIVLGVAQEEEGEAGLLAGSIHQGEYDGDGAWCIGACVVTRKGGMQIFSGRS